MAGDEPHNRIFDDEQFVQAVRQLKPAGTGEIADHIGCSQETARLRLHQLHDEGEISHKRISKGSVWYIDS